MMSKSIEPPISCLAMFGRGLPLPPPRRYSLLPLQDSVAEYRERGATARTLPEDIIAEKVKQMPISKSKCPNPPRSPTGPADKDRPRNQGGVWKGLQPRIAF